MKFKFDVTTLETCERDFMAAKEIMSVWEWFRGGYLALYLSQKNRLLKAKENAESKKNSRTKK